MNCECCVRVCCAPFRWIASCLPCCNPNRTDRPLQYSVTKVSVAVLGTPTIQSQPTPATHHRERTWKLSNGKMSYDVRQAGGE